MEAKYRKLVTASLSNRWQRTYGQIEEYIIKKETGVKFDDISSGKIKRNERLNKKLDEVSKFTKTSFERLVTDKVVEIAHDIDDSPSETFFQLNVKRK